MEPKDNLVLDHLGRYTVTLKRVLETSCFDGGSCQNSLNRLLRSGLIKSADKAIEGGFHYYQLTPKGAKSRGLPVNKARDKDVRGLAQDLAALWFSCMGPVPRLRLSAKELQTLFGAPAGNNIIYVAQNDGDDSTVYRLFIPSETSSLQTFLATLKKSAYDVASDVNYLRWIERGTYQLAILLHNEARKEELKRLITKEEFPDIRIHVDIAPTPTNLKEFITPEGAQ